MCDVLPTQEANDRIEKLYSIAKKSPIKWDAIFLLSKVNQYYFTGTMQDGVFVIKNDGSYTYFVRKSYARASNECVIGNVVHMKSYRDIADKLGGGIKTIFMETEAVPYAAVERLKKCFPIEHIASIDKTILEMRAVKSELELSIIYESGRQHKHLLENIVPGLLKEGISETEFTAALLKDMINIGYQGYSKFNMFQPDVVAGQISFGENSLYPASFNGPAGMKGMHPASPVIGDRQRFLAKGDLVFVDIGYGYCGYHTDRTQIYMFGGKVPEEAAALHEKCKQIQAKTAAMLKPGNIPSKIYEDVLSSLDSEFLQHFMGYGDDKVKFIGHGVGLHIDEYPVIAKGFDNPLEENMIISIEPKRALEGFGLVGLEDTYVVMEDGGKCITGGEKDIIIV